MVTRTARRIRRFAAYANKRALMYQQVLIDFRYGWALRKGFKRW